MYSTKIVTHTVVRILMSRIKAMRSQSGPSRLDLLSIHHIGTPANPSFIPLDDHSAITAGLLRNGHGYENFAGQNHSLHDNQDSHRWRLAARLYDILVDVGCNENDQPYYHKSMSHEMRNVKMCSAGIHFLWPMDRMTSIYRQHM